MGKEFIIEVYPEVGMNGEPTAITVPTSLCKHCGKENSLIIMNIEFKPRFKNKGIVYCKCLSCDGEETAFVRDMKGIMIGKESED